MAWEFAIYRVSDLLLHQESHCVSYIGIKTQLLLCVCVDDSVMIALREQIDSVLSA